MKSILIGYGYWGKIIKKYIEQSDVFELIGVCDPYFEDSLDLEDVLEKQLAECAFVCIPVNKHYEIVLRLLDRGIHVFCEKPLCKNLKDTLYLFEKASQMKRVLFTDYIYLASPSINYIKKNIDMLGSIKYIHMRIKQFGNFYKEDDVYEVIGVHMISVLAFFMYEEECDTVVSRVHTIMQNCEGMAESGIVYFKVKEVEGSIECSLISDLKERRIEIICQKGIIIFDMLGKYTVQIILHQVEGYKKKQKVLRMEQFDEANNLSFMLKDFNKVIQTGDIENEKVSICVAGILEQIQKKCKV